MFTKEELEIVFKVFEDLESDDKDVKFLKDKMALLNEQRKIGDEANSKIAEIQTRIEELYKGDENGKED